MSEVLRGGRAPHPKEHIPVEGVRAGCVLEGVVGDARRGPQIKTGSRPCIANLGPRTIDDFRLSFDGGRKSVAVVFSLQQETVIEGVALGSDKLARYIGQGGSRAERVLQGARCAF